MGRRRQPPPRRTPRQSAADEASLQLMRRLGLTLRDGRLRLRYRQVDAAARGGISRSEWSQLERGKTMATIATLNRAAFALGGSLDAYVRGQSAADQPRDAVHLRHQELVIRTALAGEWHALPEEPIDREARTSRAADVLLYRRPAPAQAEYALIEVFDWFSNVGEPMRDWSRRLDALERYAIARMRPDDDLPRTSGCWLIRATQRNRRLLAEHRHLFLARFPGSGRAWLAALTSSAARLPADPAMLWVSVSGERIFAVRSSGA